jgi:predicted dehydrogenase
MRFNREIKRICDSGTLGKILYAEGEYNHPANPKDTSFQKTYNYFEGHWRNYLPRTYYVTHSLGPIMWATGATPKRVTAMAMFAPISGDVSTASRVGDRAAVILTQNDDGSVFRFTGCAAFGAHHNGYRVCGTKGQIENSIGQGEKVTLCYNYWEKPEGAEDVSCYLPAWNDKDEDLISQSGHGGGDYLTARNFLDCIKEGRQPEHPFDLYSALNMSSVAILAHRSVLEGGTPYDIPDFHTEAARKQYENDFLTPFLGENGEAPTLPCSSIAHEPTQTQLHLYHEQLK